MKSSRRGWSKMKSGRSKISFFRFFLFFFGRLKTVFLQTWRIQFFPCTTQTIRNTIKKMSRRKKEKKKKKRFIFILAIKDGGFRHPWHFVTMIHQCESQTSKISACQVVLDIPGQKSTTTSNQIKESVYAPPRSGKNWIEAVFELASYRQSAYVTIFFLLNFFRTSFVCFFRHKFVFYVHHGLAHWCAFSVLEWSFCLAWNGHVCRKHFSPSLCLTIWPIWKNVKESQFV